METVTAGGYLVDDIASERSVQMFEREPILWESYLTNGNLDHPRMDPPRLAVSLVGYGLGFRCLPSGLLERRDSLIPL